MADELRTEVEQVIEREGVHPEVDWHNQNQHRL
jgi:hypothetical protein